MEFFDWMGIPQAILSYLNFDFGNTIESIQSVRLQTVLITLYVTIGLYLLGHLFGGFGLYKMAKRAEDKLAWMAFVPFLNTYLAGRLAGQVNLFGAKVKRMGLYAAILEFLYVGINIFTLTVNILLLNPAYNALVETEVNSVTYLSTELLPLDRLPMAIRWMPTTLNVMEIISLILYFITLFAFVMLYAAFFRKYYARSPYIMAFLCSFLPVRGFVLFAVRNNTPVDYNAWMQERIRMMQQQQYGGAPYGRPPYGGPTAPSNPAPSQSSPEDEPFSDTAGPSAPPDDEPFSDL